MRTTRKLSARTKELISQSLRQYHATRTETDKQITRQKQSLALKQYWQTIPAGDSMDNKTKTVTKTTGATQPIKNRTLEKNNT